MAIKIELGNKGLNGKHVGLEFVNGIAIVENEAHGRDIAARFGYKIVEESEKPKAAKPAARKKAATKSDE